VGRLRLGVGHASTVRPAPSILGVVGGSFSHHESCSQVVPGSTGQALDLSQAWRWDALGWSLEQRPGGAAASATTSHDEGQRGSQNTWNGSLVY
jgi:hypothetical protein